MQHSVGEKGGIESCVHTHRGAAGVLGSDDAAAAAHHLGARLPACPGCAAGAPRPPAHAARTGAKEVSAVLIMLFRVALRS